MSKYTYIELTLYRKEITLRLLTLNSKRNNEREQSLNYNIFNFSPEISTSKLYLLSVRNRCDGLAARQRLKSDLSHSLQRELIARAYGTAMQKFRLSHEQKDNHTKKKRSL